MSLPGSQAPAATGSPVLGAVSSDGLLVPSGRDPSGPLAMSGAERPEIGYNGSPMVCDDSCPSGMGSHVLPSQPALAPQQPPQPPRAQIAGLPVAPMPPPAPASSPYYLPPSPYGAVWAGASGGLPVVSTSPFLPPSPYSSGGVDVFPGASSVVNSAVSTEALTQFYFQQQQRSLQYAVAAAAAQHQQQQHYAMLHQRQQQMLAAAAVAAATNGNLYRYPGSYLLPSVPSIASLLSGSAGSGGTSGVLAGIPNIPSQEEAAKRAAFEQKARIAAQASVSEDNVSKLNLSIAASSDSTSVACARDMGGGTAARVTGGQKLSRSTGDVTKSDSLSPSCFPGGRKDNSVSNAESTSRSHAPHKRKSFLAFSSQQRVGARRLRTGLGTSEQQLLPSAQQPSHSGPGTALPARRSLAPTSATEASATTSALAAVASTSYFLVDQYMVSGTSHTGSVLSDIKPEVTQEDEWVYLSPKDVVDELEALLAKMSHVRGSGTRNDSSGGAALLTGAGKSGASNVWCFLSSSLPRLHSSVETKLLRLSCHSGPGSGDGSTEKEDVPVCGVCFEAQKPSRFRLAGDFMVRCRGCGIATHRRCYGVHCFTRVRPDASGPCPTFLCQVCEWRKREEQVSAAAAVVSGSNESFLTPEAVFCCICRQSSQGLLKRATLCRQSRSTTKGIKAENVGEAKSTQSHASGSALWVHVYCAVLSPQLVRIRDFRLIEEIEVMMLGDQSFPSLSSDGCKQPAPHIDEVGALKFEVMDDAGIHKKTVLDSVMQRQKENESSSSSPPKAEEASSLVVWDGTESTPCMFCGVTKGYCVPCCHKGCQQVFHVWCLRKAMYEAEQAGHNNLGAALQISVKGPASTVDRVETVSVTPRVTTIEAYCPSHAPPPRYCVCQGDFDGASETTFMVGCDTCGDWLHSSCIGPAACEVAVQSDVYQCNRCAEQQVHLVVCDRLWSCLLIGPEDWGAAQSRALLAVFYKMASFLDSHGGSKGQPSRGAPPNVERVTRKGPSHSMLNPFDLSWTIPPHTKPLLFADLILLAATWTARAELLLVADVIPLASLPDRQDALSTDMSSYSSSTQWSPAALASDDSATPLTSSRSMRQTETISGSQREGAGSVTHSDSGGSDSSSSLCGGRTPSTLHETACNEDHVKRPVVSKKRIQLQRKSEGCSESRDEGKTGLLAPKGESKTAVVSGPAADALLDAAPTLSVVASVPLPLPHSGGKSQPQRMISPAHSGTLQEKKEATADAHLFKLGVGPVSVEALERHAFGPYSFKGLLSAPQRWGFRALSSLEAIRALIKEGSRFPCNMGYWTELLIELVERCSQWQSEMNAALRSKSLEALQTCLASHTAQAFGSHLSAKQTKTLLPRGESSYLQCVSEEKPIIARLPTVVSGRSPSSRWGCRLVGALAVLVEETLHLREKAAVAVFVQQAEASLSQTSARQLTMAQLQHLVAEVEKKPELSALGGKGVRAAAEEILSRVREAAEMVKTIKANPKVDLDAVRRLMDFVRTRLPKDHGVQLQDLPDLLKKGIALEAQASQKDFRSIRRVLAQAQQLRLTSRALTDLQTMVGKADHWRREYQRVVVLMRASSLGRSKEESDPEGAQRKNVVVSGQSGFLKDLFCSSASQPGKGADGASGGQGGRQTGKEEGEPQFTQSQTLGDAQQLLNEGRALGVVCDEVEQLRQWVDKCLAWEHKASIVLKKPVEPCDIRVEDDGGACEDEDAFLQWNLLGLKRLSRARFQLPFSVSGSIANALERRQEDLKQLEAMLLELVSDSKDETASEKNVRCSPASPPTGPYASLRLQRRTPSVLRSYLTYATFLHRAAKSESSSEGKSRAARFHNVMRLIQEELACFGEWEKAIHNILDGTNRLVELIHGEINESCCGDVPQLPSEEEIKRLTYGSPEAQLSPFSVPLVQVNQSAFEAWLKRYSSDSPPASEAYEEVTTVFEFLSSDSVTSSHTEEIAPTGPSREEREVSSIPTGLQSIEHFHRAYLVALKRHENGIDGSGNADTSASKESPERSEFVEALIQYAVVLLTHFLALQRGSKEVLRHSLYKPWTRCVFNGLRSAKIPVGHVPGLLVAKNDGPLGKTFQKFRSLCLTEADEDLLTRAFQRSLSLWACTERKSKVLEQMAKILSPDELVQGVHIGESEPTLCALNYWPHSATSQANPQSFLTAVPSKTGTSFLCGSASLPTTCIYARFLESVTEDHGWMFQIVRDVVFKAHDLLLQEKQEKKENKPVFEVQLLNLLGMSTWCLRARCVVEAVKRGSSATKGLLKKVAELLGEAGSLQDGHCWPLVERLIWERYTWNSLGADQEAVKRQQLQEELKEILDQGLHWCMGAMKELLEPLSVHLYVPQLYGNTLPLVLGEKGVALRERMDYESHPMQMLDTYLALHACGVPQLLVFLSASNTPVSSTAEDAVTRPGWLWPLLAPDSADPAALHPLRLSWDTATADSLYEALTLFLEFQLFVQKRELSVLDRADLNSSCVGEEGEVTGSTDLQQFSQRLRAAERYLQTCCVLRDKRGNSSSLAGAASQTVGTAASACLTVTPPAMPSAPPAVSDFYDAAVNAQHYLALLANPRFEKRLFYNSANTTAGTNPWVASDPQIKYGLVLRKRAQEAAILMGLSLSDSTPFFCSDCSSDDGMGFLKGTCLRWIRQVLRCGLLGWTSMEMGISEFELEGTTTCATLGNRRSRVFLVEVIVRFLLSSMRAEEARVTEFIAARPSHCIDSQQPLVKLLEIRCSLIRWAIKGLQFLRDLSELEEKKENSENKSYVAAELPTLGRLYCLQNEYRRLHAAARAHVHELQNLYETRDTVIALVEGFMGPAPHGVSPCGNPASAFAVDWNVIQRTILSDEVFGGFLQDALARHLNRIWKRLTQTEEWLIHGARQPVSVFEELRWMTAWNTCIAPFFTDESRTAEPPTKESACSLGPSAVGGLTTPLATSPSMITFQQLFLREKTSLHQKRHFLARVEGLLCRLYSLLFADYITVCEEHESPLGDREFSEGRQGLNSPGFYLLRAQKTLVLSISSTRQLDQESSGHRSVLIRAIHLSHEFGFYHIVVTFDGTKGLSKSFLVHPFLLLRCLISFPREMNRSPPASACQQILRDLSRLHDNVVDLEEMDPSRSSQYNDTDGTGGSASKCNLTWQTLFDAVYGVLTASDIKKKIRLPAFLLFPLQCIRWKRQVMSLSLPSVAPYDSLQKLASEASQLNLQRGHILGAYLHAPMFLDMATFSQVVIGPLLESGIVLWSGNRAEATVDQTCLVEFQKCLLWVVPEVSGVPQPQILFIQNEPFDFCLAESKALTHRLAAVENAMQQYDQAAPLLLSAQQTKHLGVLCLAAPGHPTSTLSGGCSLRMLLAPALKVRFEQGVAHFVAERLLMYAEELSSWEGYTRYILERLQRRQELQHCALQQAQTAIKALPSLPSGVEDQLLPFHSVSTLQHPLTTLDNLGCRTGGFSESMLRALYDGFGLTTTLAQSSKAVAPRDCDVGHPVPLLIGGLDAVASSTTLKRLQDRGHSLYVLRRTGHVEALARQLDEVVAAIQHLNDQGAQLLAAAQKAARTGIFPTRIGSNTASSKQSLDMAPTSPLPSDPVPSVAELETFLQQSLFADLPCHPKLKHLYWRCLALHHVAGIAFGATAPSVSDPALMVDDVVPPTFLPTWLEDFMEDYQKPSLETSDIEEVFSKDNTAEKTEAKKKFFETTSTNAVFSRTLPRGSLLHTVYQRCLPSWCPVRSRVCDQAFGRCWSYAVSCLFQYGDPHATSTGSSPPIAELSSGRVTQPLLKTLQSLYAVGQRVTAAVRDSKYESQRRTGDHTVETDQRITLYQEQLTCLKTLLTAAKNILTEARGSLDAWIRLRMIVHFFPVNFLEEMRVIQAKLQHKYPSVSIRVITSGSNIQEIQLAKDNSVRSRYKPPSNFPCIAPSSAKSERNDAGPSRGKEAEDPQNIDAVAMLLSAYGTETFLAPQDATSFRHTVEARLRQSTTRCLQILFDDGKESSAEEREGVLFRASQQCLGESYFTALQHMLSKRLQQCITVQKGTATHSGTPRRTSSNATSDFPLIPTSLTGTQLKSERSTPSTTSLKSLLSAVASSRLGRSSNAPTEAPGILGRSTSPLPAKRVQFSSDDTAVALNGIFSPDIGEAALDKLSPLEGAGFLWQGLLQGSASDVSAHTGSASSSSIAMPIWLVPLFTPVSDTIYTLFRGITTFYLEGAMSVIEFGKQINPVMEEPEDSPQRAATLLLHVIVAAEWERQDADYQAVISAIRPRTLPIFATAPTSLRNQLSPSEREAMETRALANHLKVLCFSSVKPSQIQKPLSLIPSENAEHKNYVRFWIIPPAPTLTETVLSAKIPKSSQLVFGLLQFQLDSLSPSSNSSPQSSRPTNLPFASIRSVATRIVRAMRTLRDTQSQDCQNNTPIRDSLTSSPKDPKSVTNKSKFVPPFLNLRISLPPTGFQFQSHAATVRTFQAATAEIDPGAEGQSRDTWPSEDLSSQMSTLAKETLDAPSQRVASRQVGEAPRSAESLPTDTESRANSGGHDAYTSTSKPGYSDNRARSKSFAPAPSNVQASLLPPSFSTGSSLPWYGLSTTAAAGARPLSAQLASDAPAAASSDKRPFAPIPKRPRTLFSTVSPNDRNNKLMGNVNPESHSSVLPYADESPSTAFPASLVPWDAPNVERSAVLPEILPPKILSCPRKHVNSAVAMPLLTETHAQHPPSSATFQTRPSATLSPWSSASAVSEQPSSGTTPLNGPPPFAGPSRPSRPPPWQQRSRYKPPSGSTRDEGPVTTSSPSNRSTGEQYPVFGSSASGWDEAPSSFTRTENDLHPPMPHSTPRSAPLDPYQQTGHTSYPECQPPLFTLPSPTANDMPSTDGPALPPVHLTLEPATTPESHSRFGGRNPITRDSVPPWQAHRMNQMVSYQPTPALSPVSSRAPPGSTNPKEVLNGHVTQDGVATAYGASRNEDAPNAPTETTPHNASLPFSVPAALKSLLQSAAAELRSKKLTSTGASHPSQAGPL